MIMKKISLLAVSFMFAAVFAVSAFGQTPAGKIGWLDTGAFADPKEGITKYVAALKALDAEMKPGQTELQTITAKLKAISDELEKMKNAPPSVPFNQSAYQAKQDEGQALQRTGEFKQKELEAALQKRSPEVLGPISTDIMKALQDFAKQKGYTVVLDINALGQPNQPSPILVLDPDANITKSFVTYYNQRQAPTASTTVPK